MNKNIRDFLNSDMTESEFYNLSKEDLINLKEYLLQMKSKDKEFMDLVKEPVNSMKEKISWIDDIAFDASQNKTTGDYSFTTIWIFPKEGEHLIVESDRESGFYKDIADKIPTMYLLNKNIRTRVKRQDALDFLQEELYLIDHFGRGFYDGLLYPKKSVSGNFEIGYTPKLGMYVWNDSELVTDYLEKKIKRYDKPHIKDNEKEKVLTKIQIKK